MDPVHDRGSMDPVHESGPWTRSKERVHGPLVHVLSSPARIAMARWTREAKLEEVQRHYNNIYQSNFLLCYIKFMPL